MRRIIIADTATSSIGAAQISPSIVSAELCVVRRVLEGDKAPIHLTAYQFSGAACVHWEPSDRCRTLYVVRGSLSINDRSFSKASAIVVEAGSDCTAEIQDSNTEIYEFHHARDRNALLGGNVHAVPGEAIVPTAHDGIISTLLVDSSCSGCKVWLQETYIPKEGVEIDLHFHTEDEVIVVLEGELLAGPKRLGPGMILSVAAGTLYGFAVGKGGLRYINFRPSHPFYGLQGSDEVHDELAFYLSRGVIQAQHICLT